MGDSQVVIAVDHLLPLSNPALLSAPCKKSFSSVSCPILACNSLRSTNGSSCLLSAPNTSATRSNNCLRHSLIWVGCRSCLCAISARVFSPRTASSATCALNAGEWFRRGLLLISCSSLSGPILRPGYGETALINLFSFAGPPLPARFPSGPMANGSETGPLIVVASTACSTTHSGWVLPPGALFRCLCPLLAISPSREIASATSSTTCCPIAKPFVYELPPDSRPKVRRRLACSGPLVGTATVPCGCSVKTKHQPMFSASRATSF